MNPNHDPKTGQFTFSNGMSAKSLSNNMKKFKYKQFDRLMSAKQVASTKSGSCHDQVIYEIDQLSKLGLKPKAAFIMAVDKNGNGGETHTFVLYNENGKTNWFENAWSDKRGIHSYNNEKLAMADIVKEFKKRNKGQNIYLADFDPSEHSTGETLEVFVDKCMNKAIKV